MTREGEPELRIVHPPPVRRAPAIPSVVFATVVFVVTEVMFFGGLMSAHAITRASAVVWPPPGLARLPVEATLFNTLVLLASGAAMWRAGRLQARGLPWFRAAVAMGAFFVLVQGVEWARLLSQGFTLAGSNHAGFFYVIVGTHALHAIAGLTVLLWAHREAQAERLAADAFTAVRIFWYFVVVLWPILYVRVYL
jgi:cytochrome c oxidase subunit 3